MKVPVAPRTIGDVAKIQFLPLLRSDQVHHRGRPSIWRRLADAKGPSTDGPVFDGPWF